jgi:lambda repressor-like predicted transcriptional regulator
MRTKLNNELNKQGTDMNKISNSGQYFYTSVNMAWKVSFIDGRKLLLADVQLSISQNRLWFVLVT